MGAPIGYLDQGKGKAKIPDPTKAPLVRKTFELYASGTYSPHSTSVDEAYRLGLRNRNAGKIHISSLSVILNNPFYIGLIRLKRTNETFPGVHEPIVPSRVFKRVQEMLRGKAPFRQQQHDFLFRRLLKCSTCGYSLIGERKKGTSTIDVIP